MEFEHGNTTFTLPDKLSVRRVLAYDEAIEIRPGLGTYDRLWAGVCAVAVDWKSDLIPELKIDVLDETGSDADNFAEVLELVKQASLWTFTVIQKLKEVPKN